MEISSAIVVWVDVRCDCVVVRNSFDSVVKTRVEVDSLRPFVTVDCDVMFNIVDSLIMVFVNILSDDIGEIVDDAGDDSDGDDVDDDDDGDEDDDDGDEDGSVAVVLSNVVSKTEGVCIVLVDNESGEIDDVE